MFATDRDRQIVQAVSRFGQLTSGQISELLFHDGSSPTRPSRALNRLIHSRHLSRIERRLRGGTGAGSAQYVYQLGTQGRKYVGREAGYPYRAVHYHTLAIADAFIGLKRLEREGGIEVIGMATEPDTWRVIAGADLRPDLHVELSVPSRRMNVSLFLEIDMGTERQKQLKEKLARYWHAYQHATEADMAVYPRVLFLVPDDERLRELTWLINSGPEEAKELFRVQMQDSFPELLLS
ncbi:replication-relaxation family protein [Pseudarthrobacter sp. HLT3-5]|uniref:replication-relaxation family protein n=1 Tax=Pseudarthrobacter cellobiosi TaxID=2953654 RepID=UPI00208E1670|nr:replication-relaxation family protein [Pseudarthrobacter sp. HLT3-5]MCO4274289.1 replication-relaxation family protein [Pseudarthrobacter sp. HLT3-5]